jgi:hypothetical protein
VSLFRERRGRRAAKKVGEKIQQVPDLFQRVRDLLRRAAVAAMLARAFYFFNNRAHLAAAASPRFFSKKEEETAAEPQTNVKATA